ncbi:hypothetical protein GZ77_16880 [Endozoicomonas montiporae]|uniref:Uncharacterized protein n=2 Tax=Endozoicomonas montiporae TaxID=1027273 RepID=A0A081N648_9GAMM|nr:hypothetical protein [Endozoicomonas montiporae]AMO57156.1 hypothetical protein EZMO1_3150 [Endozoicomonas montiporae CL-33]KEQ13921.1 hypothetical protein GZ77_16880 [Endozoicomonas montiporae]
MRIRTLWVICSLLTLTDSAYAQQAEEFCVRQNHQSNATLCFCPLKESAPQLVELPDDASQPMSYLSMAAYGFGKIGNGYEFCARFYNILKSLSSYLTGNYDEVFTKDWVKDNLISGTAEMFDHGLEVADWSPREYARDLVSTTINEKVGDTVYFIAGAGRAGFQLYTIKTDLKGYHLSRQSLSYFGSVKQLGLIAVTTRNLLSMLYEDFGHLLSELFRMLYPAR